MKILFTADHHIKLGQKNVPRDWAIERYQLFFTKIYQLEADVDMHIMGGDIFDRIPRMDELQLFFDMISGISIPTLIYTGNHEADTKKTSFMRFLKSSVEKMNPNVRIVLDVETHDGFSIVPYEYIKMESAWEILPKDRPVFTHVRGNIEPHVKSEIPLEWLSEFPVVYAGDLHSHQNTQLNIVYPGSPMTTSFHRSKSKNANGYLIIEGSDWEWHDFNLPQLLRMTVQSEDDMVPTSPDHTIYELEGSMSDLANTKNSDLLDKKLVKRGKDVELILNEAMSIDEELSEYLTYILQIDNIEEIMTAYYDYS